MKTKRLPLATTAETRNGVPAAAGQAGAGSEYGPIMTELHRRAEAELRKHRKNLKSKAKLPKPETDPQRLLHELQVHQVELELQNEELRRARDEMEAGRDRYSDLYDFAPVGYMTLDREGTIAEVNLTGASLLGIARAALVKRRFGAFVSPADRAAFAAFLQLVFKSKAREECDLRLLLKGTDPVDVRLRAIISSTGQACQVAVSNVTGHKQAEEKVHVSEVRYRRLFETAHDGVLLLDPGTRKITDANPFMTRLLGYSHDQFVGKELFQIGLLKDEVASQEMFKKLKRNHEVRYEDLPLESRRGRHQEVEVVAKLYQENGHAVIQCNIRDITARKLAEDALRQSEERYRTLFNSMDEGYCIIEMIFDQRRKPVDWRFLEVNRSFEKHNGLHDAAGKLISVMVPDLEASWFEIYGKVALTGEPVRFEKEAKALAGRWFDLYAFRIGGPDSRKVAVLFNDISMRKQSEQELSEMARLLDLSHDAIIVRDMEGHIRYWNHGAEELYGWSRQEALGKISHQLLHTEYLTPLKQLTEELHRTNRWVGELVHQTRAGRRVTVLVRKTLDRDGQGHAASVLENITDITERKQAEDTRRRIEVMAASNRKLHEEIMRRQAVEESLHKSEQHQTRLLEQSRLLQEQLRQLSREILTTQEEERRKISRELHDVIAQTLTGINVRLATLKKEAASNAKGLDRNITRTQRLVEKSVDIVHQFARELRPTVLDDLGLIPALHAFIKSFTTRTGVRTRLTAFAAVEKLESSRRTALYRVAQEALTNVARHAKASRVDVSIQNLPGGICMKIKDDGKSFEVESMLRTTGKGRLGLLGMRERLEMVGGNFTVESAPGKGTTIVAHLPLGKVARGGGGGRRRPLKPRLKI